MKVTADVPRLFLKDMVYLRRCSSKVRPVEEALQADGEILRNMKALNHTCWVVFDLGLIREKGEGIC